ncbi:MAG: DUF2281 domain-containing protein [Thermodesulfobacteriota bacterium]
MTASTVREEIYRDLGRVPEERLWAVKDLLSFVMRESPDQLEVLECALMSSSALSKELNSPEEDEAWSDFNKEA